MKITIGSDHRGYELKEHIKNYFSEVEWLDVGTMNGNERFDYPIVAKKVCNNLLNGQADRGVLLCGSGVGISIAANRYPKIYAALCWSPEVAKIAREHDCANILVLPADFIASSGAIDIIKTWLNAKFLGGRHQKRLEMLEITSEQ